MKRLTIILLIITMLVCFIACEDMSKQDNKQNEPAAEPTKIYEEVPEVKYVTVSVFSMGNVEMAVGTYVETDELTNGITLTYELLSETSIKITAQNKDGSIRKLKKLGTIIELEEVLESIPMKSAYVIAKQEGETDMNFYYKYLDQDGNITQLEVTARVIIASNVVPISQEEYDRIIAELQAKQAAEEEAAE